MIDVQVSNLGNCQVLRDGKWILKKHRLSKYFLVGAHRKNGRYETFGVHRLVAWAFLGRPPKGKYIVRHLDDDQRNNAVSNLAYGDGVDNSYDAIVNYPHMRRWRPVVDMEFVREDGTYLDFNRLVRIGAVDFLRKKVRIRIADLPEDTEFIDIGKHYPDKI